MATAIRNSKALEFWSESRARAIEALTALAAPAMCALSSEVRASVVLLQPVWPTWLLAPCRTRIWAPARRQLGLRQQFLHFCPISLRLRARQHLWGRNPTA